MTSPSPFSSRAMGIVSVPGPQAEVEDPHPGARPDVVEEGVATGRLALPHRLLQPLPVSLGIAAEDAGQVLLRLQGLPTS